MLKHCQGLVHLYSFQSIHWPLFKINKIYKVQYISCTYNNKLLNNIMITFYCCVFFFSSTVLISSTFLKLLLAFIIISITFSMDTVRMMMVHVWVGIENNLYLRECFPLYDLSRAWAVWSIVLFLIDKSWRHTFWFLVVFGCSRKLHVFLLSVLDGC